MATPLHHVTARVAFPGGQVGKSVTLRQGVTREAAEKFRDALLKGPSAARFSDVKVEPMGRVDTVVASAARTVPGVGAIQDTTCIGAKYPHVAGSYLCFPCRADEIPSGIYGTPDEFERVISTHDEPIGRGATRCSAGEDLVRRNASR